MKNKKIFLFISIGLYIVSLTQKSYCSSFGPCDNFGFLSLFFGWIGVFMLHIPAFTWLANPIILASWIFFKKKPKTSFTLSVVAFIIMLSFLLVDEIIANEAGTKSRVVFYGLGYWLWVLSSFTMLAGNFFLRKRDLILAKNKDSSSI